MCSPAQSGAAIHLFGLVVDGFDLAFVQVLCELQFGSRRPLVGHF